MTKEFAMTFAKDWVNAWNSHDIEKILSLYSEDFAIETPMALKLYPQSHGVVVGKREVKKYWTLALQRTPNLQFELLNLLIGVNSICLYLFNTSSKRKSVELMCFNSEMKVNEAIVTYSQMRKH